MAQLVVFLAAKQDTIEDIENFTAIFIRQSNQHFGEEVRVEVEIHMLGTVFRRIEQFGTATFFKLQIEEDHVCGIEIINRQFEKNVVGLLERFVFGQAIVQIHFHDDYLFNIVGHVLQQRAKEVKQSFGNSLPQRTFHPQPCIQQARAGDIVILNRGEIATKSGIINHQGNFKVEPQAAHVQIDRAHQA